MEEFRIAMIAFGALLIAGALVSGLTRRSFLSLTALYVLAGFLLGQGGLGVLDFSAEDGFVEDLAVLALVVILFRDGLEVEGEMLQREWRLPLRKLVLAMPITALVIAAAGHWIVGLGWLEALLLGSLLSPTDPVLSSSVVTNPRVPRLIRHSLNLESGLNDGLALPPVLAFSAALAVGQNDFVWWRFILEDLTIGFAAGIALGVAAAWLLPRPGPYEETIPEHQKVLYAIGVAVLTYGLLAYWEHGNPFIAVYVCAIVLGIRRPDVRRYVEQGASEIVEIVKLGVFVVFGSILTLEGLFQDGWAAVAVMLVTLLLARPVAIWVSLVGTRTPLDWQEKAFMAWFGPKGVATMTYSLFLLGQGIPGAEEITNLAALCVVTSIIVHGLTDTPGAEWMARHAERREAAATVPP
ncbi:MAG: sodium:proton antiporter [Solirubrobacteraceae bacterium]|nr:sodium:proton antiporter [Solirubrobacteraceae bacterium]